jgi:hypothetical protein
VAKSIPALGFDSLGEAIRLLDRLPLDSGISQELIAMILEASTPDRHALDRMDAEQSDAIGAGMRSVTAHTSQVLDRATKALRDIPEDEWRRLVAEANAEDGHA